MATAAVRISKIDRRSAPTSARRFTRHPVPRIARWAAVWLMGLSIAGQAVAGQTLSGQSQTPEKAESAVQITVVGDSLMAGYGLAPTEGFVPQLQAALTAAGAQAVLTNAGVSGDTTAGGLARLDWSVGPGTDAVILGLGGNDALRGIPPEQSRANMDKMLKRLSERGLPVLLVGMRAPANLGKAYGDAFNGLYGDLAQKYDIALYPFFFDGLVGQPDYAQRDGIHPNAAGIRLVVDTMLPFVLALIERAEAQRSP